MGTITVSDALATASTRLVLCRWPATVLYRARSRSGSLLYIGISGRPIERWRAHSRRALWWSQASHIDFETHPTSDAALEAERHAIRDEQPAFNKRSAKRAGRCQVVCSTCEMQKAVKA
ncbi:hypothetical protein [Mycobacterium sp.]|uniref:hypothetical protein n=1 Tax=Mycobacterium sp. TaxID=1785 RepID=UPI002626CC66|nr:hypothetical protein [Mycobacterium sp.]